MTMYEFSKVEFLDQRFFATDFLHTVCPCNYNGNNCGEIVVFRLLGYYLRGCCNSQHLHLLQLQTFRKLWNCYERCRFKQDKLKD